MTRGLIVALLACGTGAFAAAPPARLTAEQTKLLKQRPWFTVSEKTLEIELRVYGPWHRQVERTADRLGDQHQAGGDWAKEVVCRQMVIEARRKLDGEGHWRVVDARLELEEARRQPGRTAAQRARLAEAFRLNDEAVALNERGDGRKALPLAERALKLYEEVLGPRHPTYALALSNLALTHQQAGDHRAALPFLQKALNLEGQLRGRRHPDYAYSLNNLATLYHTLGDHRAALPLSQQARTLTEEVLGRRHPLHATSLNNLAELHRAMGDHRAAVPLYQQALKLTKEMLGRRHPVYATSLNNLAGLYKDMGDPRAALPLVQQSLKLYEETQGRRHPAYAMSLNNLATLYEMMQDHKAALSLYRQALSLNDPGPGRQHPLYAINLNNLALLHMKMKDHKSALPLLRQALKVRGDVLGIRHPEYAQSLNNLGGLYSELGDHRAALRLYEEALRLREAVLGPTHPDYANSLNNLALLYHEQGRSSAALLMQEQALYFTCQRLSLNTAVLSERQQLAAAADLRYYLNLRLSIPDESPVFSHAHVLSWKGAAFVAQQARRVFVRARGDAATRALAEELLDTTRELALLSARSDPRSRGRLEELIRLKDEREARLAELSERFRAARTPPSTEALRGLLPEGVVLVDWLVYTGHDPTRPVKGQVWQHRLSAWVLRRDRPTVRVELGPMRPIEEAVTTWRASMEKGEDSPAAVVLRRLVWSPLEKHLGGAKLVLLSPDGPLGRLPFAALPGSKAGTYLIEEVPLAFLPVPRLLPELLRPAGGKASLLTLGGVDFDAALKGRRRERLKDDLTWGSLPGTASEAKAVAARCKGTKTTLAGKDATRDALRAALTTHRYAHLATHGYFAPAAMRSALEQRDDQYTSLFHREGVSGWHPGLLSGLVLAGANNPTEEDDGVLTALEIAEMDLSNLDLAVLSACQTGLGKEAAGEGMLGLQRAFAVAGCKSVVSSLWSVNDAATSVLMERFYHHLWEKKRSKLESLRQAQLDILKHPEWVEERVKKLTAAGLLVRGIGKASAPLPKGERRSPPAWWAAWQLSGDWR